MPVLELPDVAGPVVLADRDQRVGREALDLAAVLLGVLGEQGLGDDEHVVAALAQRRQVEVDHVEAVVEVLAEVAGLRSRSSRSRLVAATTRMSTFSGLVSPTLSTTRSCSARSSFTCRLSGSSPISSRNSVPLSASWNLPGRVAMAPVKAPRTWPNSSLSIRFSGMAPQLTGDERAVLCAGCGGELARDELLAGAGLAGDEHADVGGRDLLQLAEDLEHRRAGADDLAEALVRRAAA